MKLRKVILSKGRHKTITTHTLIREYTLIVPKSELEAYREVMGEDTDIVTIPDKITGLGNIRNWVLDKFPEDILFLDDDISSFGSVCNIKHMKITDPDIIEDILNNTYVNAHDAGARVFGLNQSTDSRKYIPHSPFKLLGWLGTVIGVIGKDMKFDKINKMRVDVDFCLKSLMEDRLIWVENRFAFTCKRNTNLGWSIKRPNEQLTKEKSYLKRRWGKYIEFSDGNGTDNVKIRVDRTESIQFGY